MVKLSELRNRSSSDGVSSRSFSRGLDASPKSTLLSPTDSEKSTTSTWTAGSPSSLSSPGPPSLGSQTKRQSFTERHGGSGGLTRKFSKKISFAESSPLATKSVLETQEEEPPPPPLTTISVPVALKGVFTDAQIKTFKQLFEHYDKDNSGAIDKEELTLVLKEMGETPTEDRVDNLMNEVDFDGNGVIDFEEFLHVMNEKRGGDSSFSAIVHKVEKKLNPLLAGHEVTFMHKGSKVNGCLIKKQGPFWSVELEDGTVVNSIPASSISRPIAPTAVRLVASASSATSSPATPSMPATSPAMSKGKSPMSKLSLNSVFKQVGVPDSPMSTASGKSSPGGFSRATAVPSSFSAAAEIPAFSPMSPNSQTSLPGFFKAESKSSGGPPQAKTTSESKAMSKKVPLTAGAEKKGTGQKAESKATSGQKAESKATINSGQKAESKGTMGSGEKGSEVKPSSGFVKPTLSKLNSTEEKKLFGEFKTTEAVKAPKMARRQSLAPSNSLEVASPTQSTSPATSEKKKPMGTFLTAERPKGAFEALEKPVQKKEVTPKKTPNSDKGLNSEDQEGGGEVQGQGIFDAGQVATFRELFRFYDRGGTIKTSELLAILSQMDTGESLPPHILNAIIEKVDRGDGRISFEAFLKGLARAKATRDYYTEERDDEDDSPIRSPKSPRSPNVGSPLLGGEEIKELKGGSSDEEEEEKWQDHRRNWFKKSNMSPQFQVWQGSPRSPSSPDNVGGLKTNPTTPASAYNMRTSDIVTGSSPNLGIAKIDSVLASLFPKAKILHSSNGTVMITPNPTGSVIESPPSRLEEIIGRFGVSSSLNEARKQYQSSEPLPIKSTSQQVASDASESEEEERRAKALRGRNLIGGILTNQQSEKKAKARSRYESNVPSVRPPSMASNYTSSSRATPLTDSSSPPRNSTTHRPPLPHTPNSGEVISSAALRLEWAKQQQQAKKEETPLSTKDLARYFAEEATPRPKVAKAPRRPPVVIKSTELKIQKPSEPLKMSPSKLMSAGGCLSSFSMCIYDSLGCVVSGAGRVVHVLEGSQAHRAGVACGDFVVGIGKYKVNSIETIQAAIESVRRDVEFKIINREMDRRKEKNSPNKLSNLHLIENDGNNTTALTTTPLTPTSPVTAVDLDDQVLVIVMTPGVAKPNEVSKHVPESKGPSTYYAVL